MNHEAYRKLFSRHSPPPDDRVVYGLHPSHPNYFKPRWNASQILTDQNRKHEPLPDWTVQNMIGDLGYYGRYKEAKELAGADQERTKRKRYKQQAQYPTITGTVLASLRESTIQAESRTVLTDSALPVSLAIIGQGLLAGIHQAIVGGDVFMGIARLGLSGVVALGPLAVEALVRGRRMRELRQDEAIAGE